MDDYRLIADAVAADIAAGKHRPGDRLPTQRAFARLHGIAGSTAARVYGELVRRGLAVGEVGRGTFVRAAAPAQEPALAEPSPARVDLELNFPLLAEQPTLLAESLANIVRPDRLAAALRPGTVTGTTAARAAAAELLTRRGWSPGQDHILFTGNGRQAIAAAIAALVPPGQRLGVEALTYPVVKAIAARLGVTLVPLDMDSDGLLPDALRAAHRAGPLRAVYLQPALHNPLGITLSDTRRVQLVELLAELDIHAVEDGIYTFLRDDQPPLAALAPDRTVLVDSLSKRIAPGLTLGFAVPPTSILQRVAAAVRSGGWTTTGFALDAATQFIADGTAARLQHAKRADARTRQQLVTDRLAGFTVHADPNAFHCWWELPRSWRAETFVAAAARHGIAVAPAAAFAVGSGHAPNAVRLALASPAHETLASALDTLARLASSQPEDTAIDYA